MLALIAGRLLESVLIGVTSRDPLTLTLVPPTMLATALLAGLLPALRAASVDPAIALRRDGFDSTADQIRDHNLPRIRKPVVGRVARHHRGP